MSSHTFIIAEAGVNHNGDLDTAKKLIDEAKNAGVDAVKFQFFKAAKLASKSAPKAAYQKQTTDVDESQYDMLKKLELSKDGHQILADYCHQLGMIFLSTPFDVQTLQDLLDIGVDRLKLSSGDITNGPMLKAMGASGLPVYLSTGMSTLGELEVALGAFLHGYLREESLPGEQAFRRLASQQELLNSIKDKVTLLHCTTQYPAPIHDVNLNAMKTIRQAFGLDVGYSDHTEGIVVPAAAVALGATVIEKHFTLSRNQPGPDHRASLEPVELTRMVESIRQIEQAMGSSIKGLTTTERENVNIVRKSLVAQKAVRKGETFTLENLTVKRPGEGISPMCFWEFLQKAATKDYIEDEKIL